MTTFLHNIFELPDQLSNTVMDSKDLYFCQNNLDEANLPLNIPVSARSNYKQICDSQLTLFEEAPLFLGMCITDERAEDILKTPRESFPTEAYEKFLGNNLGLDLS